MQLPASIQQAHGRLERVDEKLTTISESLPAAKKRKISASKVQHKVKRQISITQVNQAKLRADRDTTQRQLEVKGKELNFMKILQHRAKNNHELKEVIAGKEVEIA